MTVEIPAITLAAPAKLTLSLHITGRRDDGYHFIDAEMVSLELADRLELTNIVDADLDSSVSDVAVTASRSTITVSDRETGQAIDVGSAEDNLVTKALQLIHRRADVRLIKAIPAGAGLGGGSSDAAAILHWGDCRDLNEAARIGADVAFCLSGGRARVQGIGEIVEPLTFAAMEFTLALCPFGCSSAEVYRTWDRLGGPTGPGSNDLETAALATEPRLTEWRDSLGNATGQTPRLAGSGSTWFVQGAFPGPGRIVTRAAPARF